MGDMLYVQHAQPNDSGIGETNTDLLICTEAYSVGMTACDAKHIM